MYNVVFEYTAEAADKGLDGVRTWRSFVDHREFKEFYTEESARRMEVVDHGITNIRCGELCLEPKAIDAHVRKAQFDATVDGILNQAVFEKNLVKLATALNMPSLVLRAL